MTKLSIDQTMRRAAAFTRAGERDKARELYEGVLAAWPANARARQALAALDAAPAAPPAPATMIHQLPDAELDRLLALHGKGDFAALAVETEAVLRRFPQSPVAWNFLGVAFSQTMRTEKAAEFFGIAIGLDPAAAEPHNNLGNALVELGRLDEAIASFRRAVELKPDYALAEGYLLILTATVCDWSHHDTWEARCRTLAGKPGAVAPWGTLSLADDPALQQRIAMGYSGRRFPNAGRSAAPLPARAQSPRLRIGYFSADFHDHATLHLMAGVFREHDRTAFDVLAYSYGRNAGDSWRARVAGDVSHFFDVSQSSDADIATIARAHRLDIAIDLKGYTQNSRSEIFDRRLAPIQINMLGFPGTMGTAGIEYLIADPIVIPDAERPYYSEKIIYLPDSYFPADNRREIAASPPGRAECGLPEGAFVFCCLNANYKIGPREYDIWMRCLHAVEGSVLWLFESNPWARQNLLAAAAARGIDAARIVFAPRMPVARHLARHVHADLFLDTFNVNAHTTSSDALWAGLPVVTRSGRQLAARVSASLLGGLGLDELVTRSDAEYEDLILALARDPDRLARIRRRLLETKATAPTFDTVRYTRHLEAGFRAAHELQLAGEAPRDIRVSPLG